MADFEYVVEALAAMLIKTNNEDTPSKAQLTAKSGELPVLCFHRKLASHLIKNFPSEVPADQQDLVKRAKQRLNSPMFMAQEFSKKSLFWVEGLPTSVSALLTFFRQVAFGSFAAHLKGLMNSPPASGVSVNSFLALEAVAKEWTRIENLIKPSDAKEKEDEDDEMPPAEVCKQKSSVDGKETEDSAESLRKDTMAVAENFVSQKLLLVNCDTQQGSSLQALLQALDIKKLSS